MAAIDFAKKSRRRFEDPAGMIVWLLDKNEFADAHERPNPMAWEDAEQTRCWYCGKPGCTTCAAEQERRLLGRWGATEFDGRALWNDLRALAREMLPGLPVDAAEARVVRRERLILVADEEPAMALRAARRGLVDLAAKRLGVTIDVVITCRPRSVAPRPLPLPAPALQAAAFGASPMDDRSTGSRPEPEVPREGGGAEMVRDGDRSGTVAEEGAVAPEASQNVLEQAAAGLPELVRALFRGARVEPDPAAPPGAEAFCLWASSPMAAERLRKQHALAERIVGAAVGRPVRVTIRGPELPRLAARRSFWR